MRMKPSLLSKYMKYFLMNSARSHWMFRAKHYYKSFSSPPSNGFPIDFSVQHEDNLSMLLSLSSTPSSSIFPEVKNIYDCVSDNMTYLFWLMNMNIYIYLYTIYPYHHTSLLCICLKRLSHELCLLELLSLGTNKTNYYPD